MASIVNTNEHKREPRMHKTNFSFVIKHSYNGYILLKGRFLYYNYVEHLSQIPHPKLAKTTVFFFFSFLNFTSSSSSQPRSLPAPSLVSCHRVQQTCWRLLSAVLPLPDPAKMRHFLQSILVLHCLQGEPGIKHKGQVRVFFFLKY